MVGCASAFMAVLHQLAYDTNALFEGFVHFVPPYVATPKPTSANAVKLQYIPKATKPESRTVLCSATADRKKNSQLWIASR